MIQFPGDLELENERVLLRPLQQDDLKFLLPFALNRNRKYGHIPQSVLQEKMESQTTLKMHQGR